jgi:methyl-accepting chemotaxis protein
MKIAEALALRSDLQKRLEQLKQRLVKNARIQEGDVPAEDPVALQSELEKSAEELTMLIQRINRTNAASQLGAQTLADALAERDVLKIRYNAYRELANAASTTQGRTTRSEVKFISTVSVAAIQRKADDLAREHRELNTRIQEADWLTVLLD